KRLATDDEILMGDVAHPHAEVEDDVVPLPSGLRRDRGRAVHHGVEDGVESGLGHPGVSGEVASLTAIVGQIREVLRNDEAMVVERDRDVLVEQTPDTLLLRVAHLDLSRGHAVQLLRELEIAVIGPRLEVLEALVAVVLDALLRGGVGSLHGVLPWGPYPIRGRCPWVAPTDISDGGGGRARPATRRLES